MTKFQTYMIAIACAVVAGLCYKFVPEMREIAALFASATVGLLGWTVAHPQDKRNGQAGHATPMLMLTGAFTMAAVVIALSIPSMSCRVKPSDFYEATVDCAKVNPERTSASAAVMTCLTAAIAGNAIACIAQLPTTLHWTIDEATCVIADLAQKENSKVGTATITPQDIELRNAAVDFLTRNRIRITNTYPGEK